jgi:hypothetical protein
MAKRRADQDFDVKLSDASTALLRPHDHQPLPTRKRNPQYRASSSSGDAAPVVMMNPVHIQAFGLEDRAEAVIAMGNRQWSLTNLSTWRSESLNVAAAASTIPNGTADHSKEYVRQRQRAYMKQCLTGAKSLA